ncbi:lipid II:glycine glycyltransferase FemX [Ornithinimicrobium sediminis]|uniref:lipid II:glycine glycyltransferase FemX n=1 Tax=Ornithinimicrobium sediminis TaxID=2904603 RepID=UPI001E3FCC90|nr:peptidoglycan bridge formation glycyltransferase FemA/FemB family protein [Ornithinimicrobium sediminis]
MPLTLVEAHDRSTFNAAVRDLPISSPLQSWGYGEARRVLGQQPLRFLLRRNGSTVGALQVVRKPLVPGVSTLYAPRGPALESLDDLPEVARLVRRMARTTDMHLKIEPSVPLVAGTEPHQVDLAAEQSVIPERLGPFRRTETEQPEHTILADLGQDSDTIFAGLHKMARRNVRTAQRMGVVAARDDDFAAFWEIFDATNQRAKLGSFPRAYYETLLREGNGDGSEAYLFLSRHEGRALAGGFFLGLGDMTCYLYGGSIRDDRPPSEGETRKDAKAPDAFYWGAMQDAKEHGYTAFDFWGIPRRLDESKHSYGVFKMKLKFGTARYWFPAYDLSLHPFSPALRKALRARRSYVNYRSRGTTDDIL